MRDSLLLLSLDCTFCCLSLGHDLIEALQLKGSRSEVIRLYTPQSRKAKSDAIPNPLVVRGRAGQMRGRLSVAYKRFHLISLFCDLMLTKRVK
jgi:hypothetical protein